VLIHDLSVPCCLVWFPVCFCKRQFQIKNTISFSKTKLFRLKFEFWKQHLYFSFLSNLSQIFSIEKLIRQLVQCLFPWLLVRLLSAPSIVSVNLRCNKQLSLHQFTHISRTIKVTARSAMMTTAETISSGVPNNTMKLLFVEMGVGLRSARVRSNLLSKFCVLNRSYTDVRVVRLNLENV